NARAAIAPYRMPFRPHGHGPGQGQAQMYTSCQMPSDPLYVDFNGPPPEPVPAPLPQLAGSVATGTAAGKKKALKGKHLKGNKQQQQGHNSQQQFPHHVMMQGGDNGWHPPQQQHQQHPQQQQRYHTPNGNRFNGPHRNRAQGPANGRIARHMMGPMGGPRRGPAPVGPPPFAAMPPFQGPMPPMHCPVPPPPPLPLPPYMRRNGRGMAPNHHHHHHHHHHAPPVMPLPLMGPHHMMGGGPRGVRPLHGMPPLGLPGAPFNMPHINGNLNSRKIGKPNVQLVKQAVRGKSSIKTLEDLVNQYPIDKPWVNDEIRAVHVEKLDIENRLKGNKDDELFAKFKVQRDRFVALYESAREDYLKLEAASVMAK
ncbi:hypothetical protein KR044_001176, partial [Drosophila immigrans]